MKINEFKTSNESAQVDEGIGSTLFGQAPVAALKGMFTGKGTRATLEQDIFIKDFIGDAIASLDNGVRSGLIDPNIRGGTAPASPPGASPTGGSPRPTPASVAGSRPPSAPPGSPKAPAAGPSGGTPASPTGSPARPTNVSGSFTQQGMPAQAQQNVKVPAQNVKFNMPTASKSSPTAAGAPATAARPAPGTNAAAPASPFGNVNADEQSFIAARKKEGASQEQINQALANRRARVNKPIPPAQAGGQTLPASRPAAKKTDYDWVQGGGVGPDTKLSSVGPVGGPKKTTKENNNYNRLNRLFENIMEATGGQSISKYMEAWFNKYMGGADWQSHKAQLQPLIQSIEDSYSRDKGKGAIKKLAQAAYSVAKASGVTPAGAKDAEAAAAKQNPSAPGGQPTPGGQAAPASALQNPQLTMNQIVNAIAIMPVKDLEEIKKIIDGLIRKQANPSNNTQYMGNVAPNARPATKPTSPLTAPTLNTPKNTVTSTGAGKPGDITKGGIGFTRESRNRR